MSHSNIVRSLVVSVVVLVASATTGCAQSATEADARDAAPVSRDAIAATIRNESPDPLVREILSDGRVSAVEASALRQSIIACLAAVSVRAQFSDDDQLEYARPLSTPESDVDACLDGHEEDTLAFGRQFGFDGAVD